MFDHTYTVYGMNPNINQMIRVQSFFLPYPAIELAKRLHSATEAHTVVRDGTGALHWDSDG